MPLGYKYAERDTDSYVDWSAVGKNLSSALATEAQDRRDKIQDFEDQNLKDIDFLNKAPQGKYDPANKFTNNFAHDAKEQNAINYKLLRAGKLDPRQFTLIRQNMMNGTNQLFDLQKTYQEEFDKRMAGIQAGDLQALNIANMEYVEMFGDFSKSKGIINPLDGTVNIGIMASNPKTGVMELTKDVMPVSVAMGKLRTEIKTFKVDDEINKSIAAFGDRKEAIYQAATITGAGTITELTGIDALKRYPKIEGFKNAITEFNKAVDGTIAVYFSGNKYNLSSVLTENTGRYNAQSYVYDKDVAAKDKTKLLLKIDPSTGLPVLDESAPHFAEQKKEAEAWVRTQIMNRLDSERKVTTTSQLSEGRGKEKWQLDDEAERKEASNLAEQIGNVIKGSATDVNSSLGYFAGLGVPIRRTTNAILISQKQADGTTKEIPYYFSKSGKLANPLKFGKSLISAVNAKGLREDYVADELKRFINPNSAINTVSQGSGYSRERDLNSEFANKISTGGLGFSLNVFKGKKNIKGAMPILERKLAGIPELEIIPNKTLGVNDIEFKIGTKTITLNTNESEEKAQKNYDALVIFLSENVKKETKEKLLGKDFTEEQARAAEQSGTLELDN